MLMYVVGWMRFEESLWDADRMRLVLPKLVPAGLGAELS